MWSHRDPSRRKSGLGNIFIKNLDKDVIDNQNLNDTFSAFGNILSCKVEIDFDGKSKGYGYVHYETEEEAETAIAKVNGMLLAGKVVSVSKFKPKREREVDLHNSFTNVFIKNLPKDLSEKALIEIFSKYGPIQNAVYMIDKSGAALGFGFVNFEHPEHAQAALSLNNTELFGQTVFVGRAQKRKERQQELKRMWEERKMENMQKYQGVNLYVKNLDDTVNEENLRKEFSHCGTITSTKIMRDEKEASRGFGFVCFASPEEATKAVTEMNGTMISGKPVYVAIAQRKDVRRAQLEAQHAQRMQMRMQNIGAAPYMGAPVFYAPAGAQRQMMPPGGYPRRWQGNPGQGAPVRGYPPAGYGAPAPVPTGAPVQQVPRGGPTGAPRSGRGGRSGPQPAASAKRQPQSAPRQPGARGGYPNQQRAPYNNNTAAAIPPLPTPSELAAQTPEDTKHVLGDRIYHLVAESQPDLAGKITGMLLDSMDNAELIHLIEDTAALATKINEALEVLNAVPPAESE